VIEPTIDVAQADPRPPGSGTGAVVEGCYAACLRDCGGKLSQEHPISLETLKKQAGPRGVLAVQGIDPKDPTRAPPVGVGRL